jgi:hypothetical protein
MFLYVDTLLKASRLIPRHEQNKKEDHCVLNENILNKKMFEDKKIVMIDLNCEKSETSDACKGGNSYIAFKCIDGYSFENNIGIGIFFN